MCLSKSLETNKQIATNLQNLERRRASLSEHAAILDLIYCIFTLLNIGELSCLNQFIQQKHDDVAESKMCTLDQTLAL